MWVNTPITPDLHAPRRKRDHVEMPGVAGRAPALFGELADLSRQARDLAAGGALVDDALLRRTHQFRLGRS